MKKLTILLLCAIVPLVASEKEKPKSPTASDVIGLTGMGADVGAKAGMGAALIIQDSLEKATVSFQDSLEKAAASVKDTLSSVSVRPSPATIAVVSGAAAVYGGYKTYRSFYPTAEERAKNARDELFAKQYAEEFCRVMKRSILSQNFRACVHTNRKSKELTEHGFPRQCQEEAYSLALEDGGDEEVIAIGKKHRLFVPSWEQGGTK